LEERYLVEVRRGVAQALAWRTAEHLAKNWNAIARLK
jgi:hypothetical protein